MTQSGGDGRTGLRLDWCSHEAVKFACVHWHYSHGIPTGQRVAVGVWEDGTFKGVIIFSHGSTPEIGKPFGLTHTTVCELTRVALTAHRYPVSRMLAVAIKMLKRQSPGMRLIVSFADAAQGHHGGIYQATGWLYLGGTPTHAYRVKGRLYHPKALHGMYGTGGQSIPWLRANVDTSAERVLTGVKHKFVLPLDAAMWAKLTPLAQPYPKRNVSIGGEVREVVPV